MKSPIIVLFRQDLRLKDNPALFEACLTGQPVIPLYILDDETPGEWKMGGASRVWLHHSLMSLNDSLKEKGSQLFLRKGETLEILKELIKKYDVKSVYWNRSYEPYSIELTKKIKEMVACAKSFKGSLLFEPWEVLNKQNESFKVYTPFWKRCQELLSTIEEPLKAPKEIATFKIDSDNLDDFSLLPKKTNWAGGIAKEWKEGESAAHNHLDNFLKNSIASYAVDRDFPGMEATSKLSPYLHFGEISPRQVYHKVKDSKDATKFLSEIAWREFSHHQLYYFPKLSSSPWRPEFSAFPWEKNPEAFKRWKLGQTGYPIVDAGMRQLWATGWMHNRVRMIVASFLIKDLFISWQEGAAWFWDTLVDADLANNSASWQWVAGCGFDAAPFFRVFNPTLQGEKFDPDGVYIRQWVKELAKVPKAYIHEPWKVKAQMNLDYVDPIVSHEDARKKALSAFQQIKS